jgi:hypothetical protein
VVITRRAQSEVKRIIDAEFERRSSALIPEVEALLRGLMARRGHGGHLAVETRMLLEKEMRDRVRSYAHTIRRVLGAAFWSRPLRFDLKAELGRLANRDHEAMIASVKSKFPWLELPDGEIASLVLAKENEVAAQSAEGVRWPALKVAGAFLVGAASFLAAFVTVLAYFKIQL